MRKKRKGSRRRELAKQLVNVCHAEQRLEYQLERLRGVRMALVAALMHERGKPARD